MRSPPARLAFRASLIYALVAGLWILLSGRALIAFVADPDTRSKLEIYKGWAFVVVTAGLLYLTLRNQLRQWEKEAAERKQAEAALSESDERFHALLEQAVDAFLCMTARGGFSMPTAAPAKAWVMRRKNCCR